MTRLFIAVAALVAAADLSFGQGPDAAKVQVLSVEIRNRLPDNFDRTFESAEPGTIIRLLLTLPSRHMIEVDEKACKLIGITDDKGTDLTKDNGPAADKKKNQIARPNWAWLGYSTQISKDSTQCAVHVTVPGIPAVGANKIKLKCEIVVQCGSNEKAAETKNVILDNKLDVAIGPFSLKWGKAFFGTESPVFVWQDSTKHIKSVQFLTADGKELKVDSGGSTRTSGLGKQSYQQYYSVTGADKPCTVRVTYFDRVETVTVPVDVQVGVGF